MGFGPNGQILLSSAQGSASRQARRFEFEDATDDRPVLKAKAW